MNIRKLQRILISRTDSIGDVVLTLPVAFALKQRFPDAIVGFLGRTYTKPVIEACAHVDEFIDLTDFLTDEGAGRWDAIIHVFPVQEVARRAKQLGIPWRIGTTNRLFHWTSCNRLIRLSRKSSDLHEAQLNLRLLRAFGIRWQPQLDELAACTGLTRIAQLQPVFEDLLEPGKKHIILHPKSQGSAREWGLNNFASLAEQLALDDCQIFISGTEKERSSLQPLVDQLGSRVTDITGLMDLTQFIAFIAACDGLVAASTGPLHIAAALGKRTVGIYPPIRPMHAGRWGPLGANAVALTAPDSCDRCKTAGSCECMSSVKVADVVSALQLMGQGPR